MLHLRIWNDLNGETHLERLTLEFEAVDGYARGVPTVGVSKALQAGKQHFLRLPSGWIGDYHPAPTRQYLSQLTGQVRVTMSDGTSIETGPGTLWLIEDVEGRGHHTEVLGSQDVIFFVVTASKA